MMLKTVTLQEANGLLPLVREHFFRVHLMLANLQRLRAKMAQKNSSRLVLAKKRENIVVIEKKARHKKTRLRAKKAGALEKLIEHELGEMMKLGAVIKGLMPPHIDFFSIKNNEPIYLCWHGGEKEIGHWHQLDDGSPKRQFIKQKNCFGPHMVH